MTQVRGKTKRESPSKLSVDAGNPGFWKISQSCQADSPLR